VQHFSANQGTHMAGPASDYHRGEMNIQEQAATFDAFIGMSKWGSLAVIVGVLFATLWFCTGTGFLGSAAASVVVLVVGLVVLGKKAAAH
jgi:hypothetical protein